MLERLILHQTACPLDVFQHWQRTDALDMDTPYQRGDVWGLTRRRNLIRSLALNLPIPAVVVNDRFAVGWGDRYAVIDGKQRITTILMWLEDRLTVPGHWFDMDTEWVSRSELDKSRSRRLQNTPFPIVIGHLATLEHEREVFDLLNFGGVAQGEEDTD